jgi:hypothetical protein
VTGSRSGGRRGEQFGGDLPRPPTGDPEVPGEELSDRIARSAIWSGG